MKISVILSYLFQIYAWLLIVRCFLTWIPNIDWEKPFFKKLAAYTDIYLFAFRKFIPSIGGLDFSPIVAIILLQFCAQAICLALFRMGL